jgi:hypothetical protein
MAASDGQIVQGGVAGQLMPAADQFLQRDVDQVGRVVLGLGSFSVW